MADRAPKLTRELRRTLTDPEKNMIAAGAKFLGSGVGGHGIAKVWKLGHSVVVTTPTDAFQFPLGLKVPAKPVRIKEST